MIGSEKNGAKRRNTKKLLLGFTYALARIGWFT
jgi:hypothetical protein